MCDLNEYRTVGNNEFLQIIKGLHPDFKVDRSGNIEISKIKVIEKIDLTDYTGTEGQISIKFSKDCTFEKSVSLEGLKYKNLIISKNCTFQENLTLAGLEITDNLKIEQVNFEQSFSYFRNNVNYLSILHSQFKGEYCSLKSSKFQDGCSFLNNVVFGHLQLGNLDSENEIRIERRNSYLDQDINFLSIQNCNNLRFKGGALKMRIKSIEILNDNDPNSFTSFSNIATDELILKDFTNYGKLFFQKIKLNSESTNQLIFKNSFLGKTTFINCNFSNATLSFSESNLDEVQLVSSNLPLPSLINPDLSSKNIHTLEAFQSIKKVYERKGDFSTSFIYSERELTIRLSNQEPDNFVEKKDLYSQLKKMYDQRGDSVNSLKFQALELETHMKSPDISWSERLNLRFAFWSNNFGTDWIKAVKFLFKWSIPFYLIFIFLQGHRPGTDLNLFLDIVANYFEYLNPLRRSDFFVTNNQSEKINSWARIVDFFARIFIAFAEYQLIQAFRKYGKK